MLESLRGYKGVLGVGMALGFEELRETLESCDQVSEVNGAAEGGRYEVKVTDPPEHG
jgi:hypothetical protein